MNRIACVSLPRKVSRAFENLSSAPCEMMTETTGSSRKRLPGLLGSVVRDSILLAFEADKRNAVPAEFSWAFETVSTDLSANVMMDRKSGKSSCLTPAISLALTDRLNRVKS